MTIREQLIAEIEAFLNKHQMAPSRFGELAVNSKGFVTRLVSGQTSPTLDTVEKVRDFMRDYQPPPNPKKAIVLTVAA